MPQATDPLAEQFGTLDYSWQRARWHVKEAVDALSCLRESDAKAVLRVLADYTVQRVLRVSSPSRGIRPAVIDNRALTDGRLPNRDG